MKQAEAAASKWEHNIIQRGCRCVFDSIRIRMRIDTVVSTPSSTYVSLS